MRVFENEVLIILSDALSVTSNWNVVVPKALNDPLVESIDLFNSVSIKDNDVPNWILEVFRPNI